MKVVIYTTNDCKFSQEEKEYLKLNNVAFEEKNLEANKDFLTEMLTISNNFAGTPVTEITKDSGEKVILKGFTKEDFDNVLGLASNTPSQQQNNTGVSEPTPALSQQQQMPDQSVSTPPVAPVLPVEQSQVAVTEPAPTPAEVSVQNPVAEALSTEVTIPEMARPISQQAEPAPTMSPMPTDSMDMGVVDLSQSVNQASAPVVEPTPAPIIESLSSAPEPVAFSQQTDVSQQAPVATPASVSEPQTASDAQLNSVLQNLQNQANNTNS